MGETPLVVDPGSYVYTADPAERNLFRSTSFHSTVSVGGAEQNDLSPFELFRLVDRTRAALHCLGAAGLRGHAQRVSKLGRRHSHAAPRAR